MVDCYPSHHSHTGRWTTDVPLDEVVTNLRRIVDASPQEDSGNNNTLSNDDKSQPIHTPQTVTRLRWMTTGETNTFFKTKKDMSTTHGDDKVTVRFLRISGKVGFRDLNTFEISSVKNEETQLAETHILASASSLDFHVFTACPCCAGSCCRYVACFMCCCGVCPTEDWGQNEETLHEVALINGMNKSSIDPPRVLDASREVTQKLTGNH